VSALDRGLGGRIAVVTGAATGIGREYASALIGAGVSVGVLDVDADAAAVTARELAGAYGKAIGIGADVTDMGAMDRAAEQVQAEFGRLDILVNNAGLHLPEWACPPTELSVERWQRLLDVNVVGIVNGVRAFRPLLRQSEHAVVVNQGSVAARRPLSSYGISKLAVHGLTLALASELAGDGIRVVSIAPGAVGSDAVLSGVPADRLQALVGQQLIGRLAEPADMVGSLLFLCSDEAAFVTGETLTVSGGYPLQV
jgi:3-oxoacyl-[acyl-carrier protein] reductase